MQTPYQKHLGLFRNYFLVNIEGILLTKSIHLLSCYVNFKNVYRDGHQLVYTNPSSDLILIMEMLSLMRCKLNHSMKAQNIFSTMPHQLRLKQQEVLQSKNFIKNQVQILFSTDVGFVNSAPSTGFLNIYVHVIFMD